MKLKSKMLLWIGSPLIVIFIAMAAFSYWEASTMIEEATKREMRALSEYHAEHGSRPYGHSRGRWTRMGNEYPDRREIPRGRTGFHGTSECRLDLHGFPKDTNRPFLYGEEGVVPLDQFDATSRPWYQRAESKEGVQVNDVGNLKWAIIAGRLLSFAVLGALLYKIA